MRWVRCQETEAQVAGKKMTSRYPRTGEGCSRPSLVSEAGSLVCVFLAGVSLHSSLNFLIFAFLYYSTHYLFWIFLPQLRSLVTMFNMKTKCMFSYAVIDFYSHCDFMVTLMMCYCEAVTTTAVFLHWLVVSAEVLHLLVIFYQRTSPI